MDYLSGDWSRLNHLQVGRYAEQLVTMAFVLHGCDVYRCEVDDRGIELVVRGGEGEFSEIKVKSVRKGAYVFFQKDKFVRKPSLWAAVVRFTAGVSPDI